MKRFFEQPELETIILLNADIITTSGDTVGDEAPANENLP